jgi:hypothetical protein
VRAKATPLSILLACLAALTLAAGTFTAAAPSAPQQRSTESLPILWKPAGTAARAATVAGLPKNRLRFRTPHGDHVQGGKPWEGAERIVSNGEDYVVFLRTDPSPIPDNAEFAATVWVLPRNAIPPQPLDDVSLDVDAFMPEHGHGMNRVPEISRREDGGFDVKGLLFHMGGTWELYLDVTRGPITERAQRRVHLE